RPASASELASHPPLHSDFSKASRPTSAPHATSATGATTAKVTRATRSKRAMRTHPTHAEHRGDRRARLRVLVRVVLLPNDERRNHRRRAHARQPEGPRPDDRDPPPAVELTVVRGPAFVVRAGALQVAAARRRGDPR